MGWGARKEEGRRIRREEGEDFYITMGGNRTGKIFTNRVSLTSFHQLVLYIAQIF